MPAHLRPNRRRARRSMSGQALPIFMVAFVVLVGFTGLSIDAGHSYVAHRQTQDAADAGALAGGTQLLSAGTYLQKVNSPFNGSGACCSATLTAAHDYAQQNGDNTALNLTCYTYAADHSSLSVTWYNSGFSTCGATSGFATRVQYNSPPIYSADEPPTRDCGPADATRFNCVQVIVTSLITNYFMQVLGFSSQYTVTKATAYAQPAGNLLNTPPATAIYLYEPQTNCPNSSQCFNDSSGAPAPSRTQLSCSGGNCPTFWTRAGTKPSIYGFDASTLTPSVDTPAVESNGDMVINDDTTFCDPYTKGASWCATNPPVPAGADGYATPSGTQLFCQAAPGATFPQTAPTTPSSCSPAPTGASPAWALVKHMNGNGVPWTGCFTTCSITAPTSTPTCGGLVLNGESVASHASSLGACAPGAGDEYTIEPGKYSYIVINHGQYTFDSGTFEITDEAPVYTTSGGAYTATGIDHANEAAADFDLCTGYVANNPATQCRNLTAGVWIGHGKGSYTAYSAGSSTTSTCTTLGGGTSGGSTGTQAGGGDQTVVSGSGVTFVLDGPQNSTNQGFVVTNEVQSVQLSSPGSAQSSTGLPVLIDEENSSFIHLDGQHGSGAAISGYSGIVYQTPNASAGGVELNPATGGNQQGTLQGQVLAYSFTTFGGQGRAVDFSGGYGSNSGLSITSSGHSEPSVIVTNSSTYSPRAVDNGNGTETFSLDYTDEWALDAYDTYVSLNSGTPIFFSQNLWNPPCTPSSCTSLPPQPTSGQPSDANPQYHGSTPPATYGSGPGRTTSNELQGKETVAASDDWTETFTLNNQSYSFETLGQWTWGHEKDLSGTSMGNPNLAEINVTFPKPASGSSFTVSVFLEDGDHCGDYASAQYTFPINSGTPGGPSGGPGSVSLEE